MGLEEVTRGEPAAPGPKLRETREGPRWCVFGGKKTKMAKAHVCQKYREIVMVPTDRLSWDTKWQKVPVGNSCAD